jgi:hypothetical protein
MRKFAVFLLAAQLFISIFFLAPVLCRSVGEFMRSSGMPDQTRKEMIYGPFYRTMVDYLKKIPIDENAVILSPPREYAQYFWVLNYYFLPRRIYALPDSLLGDEWLTGKLRIKHSLFTRSDGFFFDRFPPRPSPDRK